MLCLTILAVVAAAVDAPTNDQLIDMERDPQRVAGTDRVHFVNRGEGLRAYLDEAKGTLTIGDRLDWERYPSATLELDGFEPTAPAALDDDVAVLHGVGLVQTYFNTPRGLQHVIDVLDASDIETDGAEAVLSLR